MKQYVSMLLTAVMLLTMWPTGAFAADTPDTPTDARINSELQSPEGIVVDSNEGEEKKEESKEEPLEEDPLEGEPLEEELPEGEGSDVEPSEGEEDLSSPTDTDMGMMMAASGFADLMLVGGITLNVTISYEGAEGEPRVDTVYPEPNEEYVMLLPAGDGYDVEIDEGNTGLQDYYTPWIMTVQAYYEYCVEEGYEGELNAFIEGLGQKLVILPEETLASDSLLLVLTVDGPFEEGATEMLSISLVYTEKTTSEITVTFYVGGEEPLSIPVVDGRLAQGVPTPAIPQDYVSFRGWFADPETDDTPFDFDTLIEEDLDLYAVFSNKYLVTYKDQDGKVVQTVELEPRDPIYGPTQDTLNKIITPDGKRLVHWYVEGGNETTAFSFGNETLVEDDMTFLPYFSDQYLVIFNSGGSYEQPQAVTHGETATRPTANPTRPGYDFVHWYVSGGSGDAAFDFTTPITDDIILVGKWTARTVNYTVAIWMEKPNFTGTPTPGNQAQYNYVTSVTRTGTAGAMTNLDIDNLPSNIASMFTGGHDLLKYGTAQSVENKEIQGNGLTVINLYAARKVYTYTFNLGNSNTRSMTIHATETKSEATYYGDSNTRHTLEVKYEMDISGVFPVQGVSFATFSSGFQSWSRGTGMTWEDSRGIASIRKIVDRGMLSEDGQQSGYTLTANWDAGNTAYKYRYFAQAWPGQDLTGETTIVHNDTTYVLMTEYNQDYYGDLTQKTISGLTRSNNNNYRTYYYWTSGQSAGTYTTSSGNNREAHRVFLYTRTTHPLTFNMMTPAGGGRCRTLRRTRP